MKCSRPGCTQECGTKRYCSPTCLEAVHSLPHSVRGRTQVITRKAKKAYVLKYEHAGHKQGTVVMRPPTEQLPPTLWERAPWLDEPWD